MKNLIVKNITRCVNGDAKKILAAEGKKVLFVDLEVGGISVALKGRPTKTQMVLEELVIPDGEKKEQLRFIKDEINEHMQGQLVTYTTVKSEYNKKFADSLKPLLVVENPHYSRANGMKLYDWRCVEFLASRFCFRRNNACYEVMDGLKNKKYLLVG